MIDIDWSNNPDYKRYLPEYLTQYRVGSDGILPLNQLISTHPANAFRFTQWMHDSLVLGFGAIDEEVMITPALQYGISPVYESGMENDSVMLHP